MENQVFSNNSSLLSCWKFFLYCSDISKTSACFFIFIDPYVKVWLQFGDKRIEKRKTPIFKCTLNPVFNEAFSFNVPWEKIRECSLDVMVMDFDNIGRNELIGRIQLAGMIFKLKCMKQIKNYSHNCIIIITVY